jgi:hypothetical protein
MKEQRNRVTRVFLWISRLKFGPNNSLPNLIQNVWDTYLSIIEIVPPNTSMSPIGKNSPNLVSFQTNKQTNKQNYKNTKNNIYLIPWRVSHCRVTILWFFFICTVFIISALSCNICSWIFSLICMYLHMAIYMFIRKCFFLPRQQNLPTNIL